jgi:5-methylcytosine-specific restriction enzyme subunit McrC
MVELSLVEYQPKFLDRDRIDDAIAQQIWQNYRQYLDIETPSFKTQQRWKITPKGVIGTIPLAPDFTIRIQPKTAIFNIWQMLDTVGSLKSLQMFEQLTACDRLEDLCDILAQTLARQILDLARHGLVASYQPHRDRLISPRGRIDWPRTARSPWQTRLPCHYTTRTADIPDNQILLWTLHHLRRTRHLCRATTQAQLAHAHRALRGSISLVPFTANDCRDRLYDRLNADYQIPHTLCGFFLEHLSPGQHHGDRHALPFLLNTAQLYEAYVAAWLAQHLPPQYRLKAQDPYKFSPNHRYKIDLTIYDRTTNKAIAVLDTKYKTPEKPSNTDINQILTYAHFKKSDRVATHRAILIYPESLPQPLDQISDTIHLQSLVFGCDPDKDGAAFLAQLGL